MKRGFKQDFYPTISQREEALLMHQYWEEKYLRFMMICVDEDPRIEKLINRSEQESQYWLDKYNALTVMD